MIGIVGYGFVGRSLEKLFGAEHCRIFDPFQGFGGDACRKLVNECPITFVSVPTQPTADGHCDTSIVEEAVRWIRSPIIVIRSTVPPGTTDRLTAATGKRIVFQPEYVGETAAHPLLDHRNQPFAVLGGRLEDTSPVADLYKGYYHSDFRFYFVSAVTAELAKYMENAFYAVKVTFCNEFYDLARAFGVDPNELREAWLADPRISRDHTFVYPDSRGFSGRCLPKDVTAIIQAARDKGVWPTLLQQAMLTNVVKYRVNDAICEQFVPLLVEWERPPADAT
jgi:UDPglucose 6-dehydrogenase